MNRLTFLDELLVMIRSGEIKTEESSDDAERLLLSFKLMVYEELKKEIFEDVTDIQTVYYAPEFDSWKAFLNHCNGNDDYAAVLAETYTEEQLEGMWNCSHIVEDMPEEQIKSGLLLQIEQLKMLDIVNQHTKPVNPDEESLAKDMIRARLKGLFSILYEG